MHDWEPLARELLWAHLLDRADRVNDLATTIAIDVRDGETPGKDDCRRLKAALDDLDRSLNNHVDPLTETAQFRVDAQVDARLGD